MFVDRQVHPMVKILNYMYEKELRPVELLRSMDKTVSFKLTKDEFLKRCQVGLTVVLQLLKTVTVDNELYALLSILYTGKKLVYSHHILMVL